MTTRLLIVGQPSEREPDLETVAERVATGNSFLVRRCRSPAELVDVVASVARRYGPLEMLDLHDHGAQGLLMMGDEVLFASSEKSNELLRGAQIARSLSRYLVETAHVRLLGCNTSTKAAQRAMASGMHGRLLLTKLAVELGGERTAFGTIRMVEPNDFRAAGFALGPSLLYSSHAAIDALATAYYRRQINIGHVFKNYPKPPPCPPRLAWQPWLDRVVRRIYHCATQRIPTTKSR